MSLRFLPTFLFRYVTLDLIYRIGVSRVWRSMFQLSISVT